MLMTTVLQLLCVPVVFVDVQQTGTMMFTPGIVIELGI